jgi:hypothetical protein
MSLPPPHPSVSALPDAPTRAEDIAYTINHAIACTVTDFIDPYVGNLTQKYLGRRYSVGCGHDHSKDPHHHHHDHGHHHGHSHHHDHLGHWWLGELAGDFGAVPVTMAAQSLAPGAMKGIQAAMEPLLGGFFRNGARRAAASWAAKRGLDADAPETKAREEEIYRYEAEHFPQALLWTLSSVGINLGTQRLLGNHAPLWQLGVAKATGASVSAGLVIGARGLMPQAARNWDNYTSTKLFLPATKAIGGLFGVSGEDVDRMAAREHNQQNWETRVQPNGKADMPGHSR